MKEAFDNKKYLREQQDRFEKVLKDDSERPKFVEFGGKPFSDHHAERVLPGYDPEAKAEILKEMVKLGEVVMVVNALDMLVPTDGRTLKQRIRGDSQLFYDKETLRMIADAHRRHIPIHKAVMAVTPREMTDENRRIVDSFRKDLERMDVRLYTHYKVEGYPNESILDREAPFAESEVSRAPGSSLIAVSPGGGSGKFGMLLAEMYDSLLKGEVPKYVKFETFPIYQLDARHPLNQAFAAATADLQNEVVTLRSGSDIRTSYDKDIDNFLLLKKLFEVFGQSRHADTMHDAVDMGVNQIVKGIVDMEKVIAACRDEVCRRIMRYEKEVAIGIEKPESLTRAKEILGEFDEMYRIGPKSEAPGSV